MKPGQSDYCLTAKCYLRTNKNDIDADLKL